MNAKKKIEHEFRNTVWIRMDRINNDPNVSYSYIGYIQ